MKIKSCEYIFLLLLLVCEFCYARDGYSVFVTGRVVDYRAVPVDGADVTIYEMKYRDGEEYAEIITSGKTNNDGLIEFNINVTDRPYNYIIVAKKEGLALAWDVLSGSSRQDRRYHFHIVFEKPYTLSGIVVDHNGAPVTGAEVQAIPETSYLSRLSQRPILAPKEWFTTRTDSKGVFVFDKFAADVSSDFWVKAPGWHSIYTFTVCYMSSCGFEVGRPDIRLALPPEREVTGKVIDKQTSQPVEGLELMVRAQRDREDIANRYRPVTAVSDKNGEFVFEGLPVGNNRIRISSHEEKEAQWVAATVDVNVLPDKPVEDIKFYVEKGNQALFTVKEVNSEKLLSGVRVSAYGDNGSARSITDSQGQVRLRLLPGEYQVYASGISHLPWRVNEPLVVQDGQASNVDILLDKNPDISGRVSDMNKPAENVLVTVHPFGSHVYTDESGRFTAGYDSDQVERGLYIIARDLKNSRAAAVKTNELNKPVELSLSPGLTVNGKIADSNNVGIPAARVSLCIDFSSCLSEIGPEVLTDSDGCFKFDAITPKQNDFSYRISIHASGFAPQTYNRVSIEGESGTIINLDPIRLLPADVSITGVVVDANGLPAPRVPIFLHGHEGTDQPDKSTATDDKGRFVINRICKAPLRLQANFDSSPGGAGFLIAEGGDSDVKIILGQTSVHRPYVSLLDKKLPQFKDMKTDFSPDDVNDKSILVCFFDMQQRPSRRYISRLNEQIEQLREKGVAVIGIQASKVEDTTLDDWIKSNSISFPIGTIEGDPSTTLGTSIDEVKFKWGVKALPWLILTDKQHIVRAEGFVISELDEKIQ